MNSLLATLAALALCSLCSCASIITGSTDSVTIQSNPTGARFETNTGSKGVTPCTITVPDSETLDVTVKMDGYEDSSADLAPRMSGWLFGNILFGGLIGLGIDLVSGNWRTHDDKITVNMVPVAAGKSSVAATQPGTSSAIPKP